MWAGFSSTSRLPREVSVPGVQAARPRKAEAVNGSELIATERQRQIEAEGWTPEHDDEHINGELADAAAIYVAHVQYGQHGDHLAFRG